MQSQLEGVSERCQVTERQLEKARVELKDIETILHNNQDEMSSLHEQLTEVRGQRWRWGQILIGGKFEGLGG